MKVHFWCLGGASGRTFVGHTFIGIYFTFGPPLFKWCPSLVGFIPLFPFGPSSSLLEFSLKVSRELCSCCEGLHPLGANFGLFRDHYCFVGSSSPRFVLALMEFELEIVLDFLKTCSNWLSSIRFTF